MGCLFTADLFERFRTSVRKLEIFGFLKEISGNLQKNIDFFRKRVYTVVKWSEMVAKWSKMEEMRHCDRKISSKTGREEPSFRAC